MKPPEKPPSQPGAGRKKYSRPVLRTYGTIRAMTRNTGTMSVNADGSGMFSKTG